MMETKTCTKCKRQLPLDAFYSDGHKKSRRRSHCKQCSTVDSYSYRSRHHTNFLLSKKASRLRKQGCEITYAELKEMHDNHSGVCDICGQPEEHGHHKTLSVDHCHETGRIRGFLCHKCNILLGMCRNDPSILHKAAEYLSKTAA